jgi:hypothetical protein
MVQDERDDEQGENHPEFLVHRFEAAQHRRFHMLYFLKQPAGYLKISATDRRRPYPAEAQTLAGFSTDVLHQRTESMVF